MENAGFEIVEIAKMKEFYGKTLSEMRNRDGLGDCVVVDIGTDEGMDEFGQFVESKMAKMTNLPKE